MKNPFTYKSFSIKIIVNFLICLILNIIALTIPIKWFTLTLPIIFFFLISLHQPFHSVQHALFIAILMVFIPILSAMTSFQSTLIYSLFYILSFLSFDIALQKKRKLPFPDVAVPIFILIAILLGIPVSIQFGLCASYYLTRIAALILLYQIK